MKTSPNLAGAAAAMAAVLAVFLGMEAMPVIGRLFAEGRVVMAWTAITGLAVAVVLPGLALARTLQDVPHWLAWTLALIAAVADVGTTVFGLQAGLSEANPLALAAMETLGIVPGLIALKALHAVIGITLLIATWFLLRKLDKPLILSRYLNNAAVAAAVYISAVALHNAVLIIQTT